MSIQSELVEFLEGVAHIAHGVQQKLAWFLLIALLASGGLAFKAYSADSQLWWNVIKCGLILLPVLIWVFIWSALSQLQEAPSLAVALASREDGLISTLESSGLSKKSGITGLYGTLRAFREEEGLGVVLETIGSVTMLANPFFALVAFLFMAILIMIILVAPFILFL